jgi:hypothetical protein
VQIGIQVCPQQAQLHGVFDQQTACGGGFERAAAHQQHGAGLGFEGTQALRHSGLRDRQAHCSALKTALFHNGGKAFQGIGFKGTHRFMY